MSEPASPCEPIVLLGSSRWQQLTQILLKTFQSWREQWGGSGHAAVVIEPAECFTRRATLPGGRLIAFGADGADGPSLLIAIPADQQHELLGVTAPHGAEIASVAMTEALQALCSRISECVAAERIGVRAYQGDKLAHAWSRNGCTVTFKTASDRALMWARVSPQLLLAMLPTMLPGSSIKAADSLASRRSAIGEEVVDVHAWLGEAEVTLSDLTTLQVGDVILLQASVTGAGYLALPDGRQLASIRLGRAGGQRAVNVISKAGASR